MSAARPLIIMGAGGHGRVVLDAAFAASLDVAWVIDDAPASDFLFGVPLAQTDDPRWKPVGPWDFLVAVGMNSVRAKLYESLCKMGGRPVNVVHPAATISPRCRLGSGVVVMAGVVANPGATIGDNTVLNTSCSVDHDCEISNNAQLGPGVHLAGNVRIGESSMIGTGASIIPGVRIGDRCEIGAGAVVTGDIPDDSLAVGIPARVIGSAQT